MPEEIRGEFLLKWDGRRYYVPAQLRKLVSAPWVLTRHADGLRLYSNEEWQKILETVRSLEDRDKKEVLIRNVVAPAIEVDLTKKDLYIPEPLRRAIKGRDARVCFDGRHGEFVQSSKSVSENVPGIVKG